MDALIDACVLDVFAGTGALGLEALSRGASEAVFVDQSADALSCCQKNIAALKMHERAATLRADGAKLPSRPVHVPPRNLVFLDPPYKAGLGAACLASLKDKGWLAAGALCVFETSSAAPEKMPDGYTAIDARDYGAARVLFFRSA
jgi:16S rRNA (guanine966-N2)-methyltransferase